MRYPAAETAEKHTRILEQASRLFRERGFSGVSVSEIMKATGLTHGPFYNHFASKEALIAETLEYAAGSAAAKRPEPGTPEQMIAYVDNYLGTGHRDVPGSGCMMPALGSEVAREPGAKAAFTLHVSSLMRTLEKLYPWRTKKNARGEAVRMAALMVGAAMLARAVDDPALSDEILREAREAFAQKR